MALANVNKGNCILSVSVHNKKVTWHCAEPASQPSASDAADALPSPGINTPAEQHATFPSTTGDATGLANLWLKASSCNHAPDLTNSIPDPEGRLWGEEQEKPCAYRADNNTPVLYQGFLPLKFETTPACSSLPTATNSMPDAQNRLFGWDQSQQEYCAFKDASIGQPVFASSPFTAPPNAPEDAGPELAPSAAGVPAAASGLTVQAACQCMVGEATTQCEAACTDSDKPPLFFLQVPAVMLRKITMVLHLPWPSQTSQQMLPQVTQFYSQQR